MSSSVANDLKESIRWSGASLCSENITFDPVSCFRKLPLTYNESSAKLLSSPAYFTDVCTPDNSCSPHEHISFNKHLLSATVDKPSAANVSKNSKIGDGDDDDDVIVILERTHMSQTVQNTHSSKMCQKDIQPIESNTFMEDNANFTDIGMSVSEAQILSTFPLTTSLSGMFQQSDTSVPSIDFSGEAIPFLDSVSSDLMSKDNSSSFPLTLQGISLDTFDTSNSIACDANESIDDELYNCSSNDGLSEQLNFKRFSFSDSLKQLVQDDSSIEMIDDVQSKAEPTQVPQSPLRNSIDVIEISDSEDDEDSKNVGRGQCTATFSRRISGGERIMPQLIPLCSELKNQDENNNSETAIGPKADCYEVIDVPSSPEMPKLIPFTSETEEPPIKTENSVKTENSLPPPLNCLRSSLQPKVVLKKLSMESYQNQKSHLEKENKPCYIHHIKIAEETFIPSTPDIDMIDGLNFYSFSSKSEMEMYWEKYSDKMKFQVEGDDNSDNSDFSYKEKNVIVPTKTTDITQIKGWRTKYFAPENKFHLFEKSCEETKNCDDYKVVANVCEMSAEETTDKENGSLLVCKEKTDNQKEMPSNTDDVATVEAKGEIKIDMCAFVSDALESFLGNESKLNVSLLRQTNPNIDPIPSDASILSLGKLKKADRLVEGQVRSNLASMKNGPSGVRKWNISPGKRNYEDSMAFDCLPVSDNTSSGIKIRKKSAGVVASDKVLKKSRQFKSKSETPVAQRLVLRLKKENSGTCNGYKIADISSEMSDIPDLEPSAVSSKQKTKAELCVPKEPLTLIKQTLFSSDSKKNESKLLSEFLTNLNRLGTRNDLTMLVSSNQAYFNTTVISLESACASTSVFTNIENFIKSQEQLQKHKAKVVRPPFLSKYKIKNKPSFKMKNKTLNKKCKVVSISNIKDNHSSIPLGIRGKRSIRLPARFLDSAILAAGSEWVSPVMSFDPETNRKPRKNSFQAKEYKDLIVEAIIDRPSQHKGNSLTSKNNSSVIKYNLSTNENVPVTSKDDSPGEKNHSKHISKISASDISCTSSSLTSVSHSKSASSKNQQRNDVEPIRKFQVDPCIVSRCKRISSTPSCMCKNSCSRALAYDPIAKRLKCSCTDAVLETIRSNDALSDVKNESADSNLPAKPSLKKHKNVKSAGYSNRNLHNYAAPVCLSATADSGPQLATSLESAVSSTVPDNEFVDESKHGAFGNRETDVQIDAKTCTSLITCQNTSSSLDDISKSVNEQKSGSLPSVIHKELSNSPKPTTIPIPGTNKYVSFVIVPKKSPNKAVTTAAPSSGLNNIKVSPTKSVPEKPSAPLVWNSVSPNNSGHGQPMVHLPVGMKPPIFIRKVPANRPQVIGGIYCSTPSNSFNTSTIFTMNNKPILIAPKPDTKIESGMLNNVMPLNSTPVVFALSPEGLVSTENIPMNLKSIEVQKDHIFLKSTIKDGFTLVPANSQTCSSVKPIIKESFSLAHTSPQPFSPSKPAIKEAFSLASATSPTSCSAPVPSSSVSAFQNASTVSPTSSVNTVTEGNCNIKIHSGKNPQSLRAVKFGDKYILCPTLSSSKCAPNENIITLYPAEVSQSSPSKLNGPTVVTVARKSNANNTAVSNSNTPELNEKKISVSCASSDTSMLQDAEVHVPSGDKVDEPLSDECCILEEGVTTELTLKNGVELSKSNSKTTETAASFAESAEHLQENSSGRGILDHVDDDMVDVETVEPNDLRSELQNILKNGPNCGGSSSNSVTPNLTCNTNSDVSSDSSSGEDNCDNSKWLNESLCAKLNCNKKSLLERNRRMELRKYVDELRASDPQLEDKQNLIDVLNTANDIARQYTAENFKLSMKVKILLMKRAALLKELQSRVSGLNAPREALKEVLKDMVKPQCRNFSTTAAPSSTNILTSAVVSKMKMNLKKKIESPVESECSAASTQSTRNPGSSELYELLKCDEKPFSSPDNALSEEEKVDDPHHVPLQEKKVVEDTSGVSPLHELKTALSSPGHIKSVNDLNNKTHLLTARDKKQNSVTDASQLFLGQQPFSDNKKSDIGCPEQRQSDPVNVDSITDHPHSRDSSSDNVAAVVVTSDSNSEVKSECLGNSELSSQEQPSSLSAANKSTNSNPEVSKTVESISKWYSSFGVVVDNVVHEKESHRRDKVEQECVQNEIPDLNPLVIDETANCSKENEPSSAQDLTTGEVT